jgi:hypothetical protein
VKSNQALSSFSRDSSAERILKLPLTEKVSDGVLSHFYVADSINITLLVILFLYAFI